MNLQKRILVVAPLCLLGLAVIGGCGSDKSGDTQVMTNMKPGANAVSPPAAAGGNISQSQLKAISVAAPGAAPQGH